MCTVCVCVVCVCEHCACVLCVVCGCGCVVCVGMGMWCVCVWMCVVGVCVDVCLCVSHTLCAYNAIGFRPFLQQGRVCGLRSYDSAPDLEPS